MKKILAIVMAMVMVLALTVAVAADDLTVTHHATAAGWSNSDAFNLDAFNDDDVVTITLEVATNTAGWWQAGINYGPQEVLFEAGTDTTATLTVGEFKSRCPIEWGYQLFFNSSEGDIDVTVTMTVASGAGDNTVDDGSANEPAGDSANEPANDGSNSTAPNTGLALAVVPAIVAMAAVAVSKKH